MHSSFLLWYRSDPPGAASSESTRSAPLPTWHLLSRARALECCCTDGRYDDTLNLFTRTSSRYFFPRSMTGTRYLLTGTCQSRVTTAVNSNVRTWHLVPHSTLPGTYAPGIYRYFLLYVYTADNVSFSCATRRRATRLETHGAHAYVACARERNDAYPSQSLWPPCCEHVCILRI